MFASFSAFSYRYKEATDTKAFEFSVVMFQEKPICTGTAIKLMFSVP